MNYNDRIYSEMYANLQNCDVSSGISLTNRHNIYQFNESSNFNDKDWGIKNGDVSGGNCYTNSHTFSLRKNHNSVDSSNNRDENSPNLFSMENNELKDGVDIDIMLP